MRYTGNTNRRTVTIHLGFLDQPIKITNLNDLPPGYHFKLSNPETITEVFEAVLPEDLAHILLYQATSDDLEEFMSTWIERSEHQDQQKKKHTTPPPANLSDLINGIINNPDNPFGPR